MSNALGFQTGGLKNDPQSKKKKFFPCLIVCDVYIKHYYLLHDDQLTILSRNPIYKAKTVQTFGNR